METPIYFDWSFWALVVSIVAIILSQLPHVKFWFKKAKLDLELYSKISITHKLGNPNLQLHLILSNIGGRKVKVKNITLKISRNGKNSIELPIQNYLQNQDDKSTILFTTFSLFPTQEWAHIVNCFNFFDRDDEKKYQEIEGGMLADYREKKGDTENLIEISSELVNEAMKFFEEHYFWNPGEYTMTVNVLTDKKTANLSKNFRFTIFESQTETLSSIKENFKYGGGIWWEPNIQNNVMIQIAEA